MNVQLYETGKLIRKSSNTHFYDLIYFGEISHEDEYRLCIGNKNNSRIFKLFRLEYVINIDCLESIYDYSITQWNKYYV